jgi:hypothetical protein
VVERGDRRVGAEVVGQRYTGWGYPRIVAVLAGVFLVLFGVWALAAPEPFFESVATFEPYNQHFVQDLGAFQIGLGAVLVLAATFRDALVVGLLGVGLGSAAHVVSHAVGHDLGGEPAVDIPFFSIVTVLLVSAGMVRLSRGR